MSRANTERGLLNINNVRLGYLFIWDTKLERINRINIITPLDTNLFKDKVGFDIDTSVESGAQFQGNIDLSKIQIDALELEVSRKSSFSSINLQTTAIRNPVLSLKNAMNRSPIGLRKWE